MFSKGLSVATKDIIQEKNSTMLLFNHWVHSKDMTLGEFGMRNTRPAIWDFNGRKYLETCDH